MHALTNSHCMIHQTPIILGGSYGQEPGDGEELPQRAGGQTSTIVD